MTATSDVNPLRAAQN